MLIRVGKKPLERNLGNQVLVDFSEGISGATGWFTRHSLLAQSAREGGLWAVLSSQNISFSKECCQTGEYAGNMYYTIRWS